MYITENEYIYTQTYISQIKVEVDLEDFNRDILFQFDAKTVPIWRDFFQFDAKTLPIRSTFPICHTCHTYIQTYIHAYIHTYTAQKKFMDTCGKHIAWRDFSGFSKGYHY